MALQGFNETYYLGVKLAALKVENSADWGTKDAAFLSTVLAAHGFNAESHYQAYGWAEGLAPNAYFNAAEYKLAKATAMFDTGGYTSKAAAQADFEAKWGADPYLHYLAYGFAEGVNPSNAFDESSYLETKLAALQAADPTNWPATKTAADVKAAFVAAGLTSLGHYEMYGNAETGVSVTAVPTAEQVASSSTSTAVVGTTYALTTGADILTGTADNDTFNGYIDSTAAAPQTLTAADSIDGGAGTDTLSITVSGTTIAIPAASITNVETINVRAAVALAASDLSTIAGVTAFNSDRSIAAITVTNLAAGGSFGMIGDGSATTAAAYNFGYATAATASKLNISGGLVGTGTVVLTGAGVLSSVIDVTGTAANALASITNAATSKATTINASANLTSNLTTTADTSLTITGAGLVDLDGAALNNTIVTINGSSNTGGVRVAAGTSTSLVFTGGSGNDYFTTAAALNTGSAAAGTGTDRLIQTNAADINSTTLGAKYTGFEVLQVGAIAVDMDNYTGSTIGAVITTGNATISDMNAAQAANITAAASQTTTFGVKDAAVPLNLDTVHIDVNDGAATTSTITLTVPVLTGIETLQLVATDNATVTSLASANDLTSTVVTGAGNVSITTAVHVVSVNESFNLSGVTGTVTFDAGLATTNAFSYTGAATVDTFTNSVVGGNIINTGAGNDLITLTLKTSGTADKITGGTGGDVTNVNLAYGNAADDQVTFIFADGDSVIDSSVATGYLAATMDSIYGIDLATAAAAGAGNVFTFDTAQSATSHTFSSTAVTFGTTTVTNAYDFYVYNTGAGGITYVYQDTDGDKIIENGEFGIQLTGVAGTATVTGEFSISSGNLVLSTLVG